MLKYASDFETTTDPKDCRVWAWASCEIGEPDNITMGTRIDDFMAWCESNENSVHYFHNLRFDGEFIIYWLETCGYTYSNKKQSRTYSAVISGTGQFYAITVIFKRYNKRYKKVTFFDSYKKLPFTVEKIAKDFKLQSQKLTLDYHKKRPVGHILTEEEIQYIKSDVQIMAEALNMQAEQGLWRMTIGSDALGSYKDIVGKDLFRKAFPVLNKETDADIRQAYRGGWTYVNKKFTHKNYGDVGAGMTLDINSMYPAVMYTSPMPYDYPLLFEGQYQRDPKYNLYIQHMSCEFRLKPDHVPTIQLKNNLSFNPTQYVEYTRGHQPVNLYLTNVDLDLFFKHYDVWNIEYINGWKFKSYTGMFCKYIDHWMHIKETATGAERTFAKLMLNNLYGKFATNPDVTGKVPYLHDQGHIAYKMGEKETRDPVYTPVGLFITSEARSKIINAAQRLYDRFIYADTDSLHLLGTETPQLNIHESRLGAWKIENYFTRGRFIRAKTYAEEIEGKIHVTCAGMPDNIKQNVSWDNFTIGFKQNGKLRPLHVPGGIVLIDSPFSLQAGALDDWDES